jgi:hypothetical protein
MCLCVGWLIYVGAMNLMAWHFAKEMSQTKRNLYVVPTPRSDLNVVKLEGPRVYKFGVSFQLFWKSVKAERTFTHIATMSFADGGGLLVFDPHAEPDGAEIMRGRRFNKAS